MGKKYIIELEDKPFHKDGDFLCRVKGFNSLVFDMTGIGMLTPYTEPDLEQVRKEAYDKGYDDAAEEKLADAWEAARKIANMTDNERFAVLGTFFISRAFCINTAAEAIAKIKEYEDGKHKFEVGDEIAFHNDGGRPDTVVVVTYIGDDGYVDGMDGRGTLYAHKNPKRWTKTGRHFPEIATVLEKMRGEQDG